MNTMKIKASLFTGLLISSSAFSSNTLEQPWSEATKIVNLAGHSEGASDIVVIEFEGVKELTNPANCRKTDMYTLHISDSTNSIGKHLMGIALAAGTAKQKVQYKIHRSECKHSRPLVSELSVIFD